MANQVTTLRMEQKFKKTPVGEIPLDWESVRLGDLCSLITKGTTPTTYGFQFTPTGVHFIKVENINKSGRIGSENMPCISEETHQALKRSVLQKDDILFSIAGALGRSAIVTNDILPANTNQALAIIRLQRERADSHYIRYFLDSDFTGNHISSIGTQGAQINLSLAQVGDIPIALPSIEEQKKIADILSAVDDSIDKTNTVIEKIKEFKKGLAQGLLVHGIGHKKFKKTSLGNIPIEWEVEKLGDLCTENPEYGANVAGRDYTKGLPRYIRITDIADNGSLADNGPKSISNEDANSYMLGEGNLLFARSGATVGKTYLYKTSDGSCAFAGYLIRFKPNPQKLLPEYLFQVTHSEPYYRWVKGMLRAGAQPNINATEYADLRLAVPSVNEQRKILTILLGADDVVSHEQEYKERLENTKKGLLNMLLTGKVRCSDA